MAYGYLSEIPEFNLRNRGLVLLATEAAIDIDICSNGRQCEEESVKHLSHLLNELTQGEEPQIKLPDNCVVLGYVISGREHFEEYWSGKHIDEVVLQTNLIAKDLRDFKSLPKSRQKTLSNFCLNLSKEIERHQQEYYPTSSRLVA